MQAIEVLGEKVKVEYTDILTDTSNSLEADIVIAADGAHSAIRKSLLPEISSVRRICYVVGRYIRGRSSRVYEEYLPQPSHQRENAGWLRDFVSIIVMRL